MLWLPSLGHRASGTSLPRPAAACELGLESFTRDSWEGLFVPWPSPWSPLGLLQCRRVLPTTPVVAYCPGRVAQGELCGSRPQRVRPAGSSSHLLHSDAKGAPSSLALGAQPSAPVPESLGLDEIPARSWKEARLPAASHSIMHAPAGPATLETQVTLLNSAFPMCLLLQALGILPDPGLPPALGLVPLPWRQSSLRGAASLGNGDLGPYPAPLISVPCLALGRGLRHLLLLSVSLSLEFGRYALGPGDVGSAGSTTLLLALAPLP